MPRSAVALARLTLSQEVPNTDAQLLSAFISSRADDPFAELVRRHGPMVLAVCRRVLSDPHDAEDAFQATFLVLARKAGSVRGSNVAGWLYGVAVRTARGVRLTRDRRERRADPDRKRDHTSPAPAPDDTLAVAEQAAIVDEELARLPELYRVAVVLCELRGLSRREAATELGVPEGTVSSRLAAAKRKLASRLAARGVAPSVALAVLTSGAMTVSAELVRVTTVAVSGAAGGTVGAAAAVVLKAMLFDQLRAGAVAGAVCLALACGGLAMTGSADAPAASGNATAPAPRPVDDPMAKLIAQLGSESFAEREAAEEKLKELGAPAKSALLVGLKSDNPEIARRCAAVLPALRRADWQRATAAFAANPDTFKHPVWTRLKDITGDGPDARAIFAELLANERSFVAIIEAIENANAAERLHRTAHARLARDLKDWYAAESKRSPVTALTQWSPERGTYPAMLLLGTFPGTEAVPAQRVRLDAPRDEHTAWHACWAGLGAEHRPTPGALGRPPAALQRLFVAWLGARENPDAAVSGFSTLLMLDCREGAALARAVAADTKRTERARGWALLYLAQGGTAADTAAAVAAFGDTREFASSHERTLQMRDIATAVALKLNGEEPADWGFSVRRGAAALKSVGPHQLGFASNFVRDPLLKAAQAKVTELTAPLRTAPAPRAKP
ncbi:sigma-70 family RNA polymerase sigma factor [Gemmata sp. JC673]|uniref:Sigma-70 family RNA polymerase sigma factor n=1 Tax=Gemmata algarum TaxID=2975278 RepID=A0ABU5EX05_9BACT|nr:sigma-70 family RNA polymerase sigma factor [Gemmata algarum]MDY3559167.1 sigma-70 family RNA polymerase sigma factor [Gemmata algarum]